MDGAEAGMMSSLQARLSLAASAVIVGFALAVGAWSFSEAFLDARELQDQQLKAISQAFGLHGLPLPQEPQKIRQIDRGIARLVIEPLGGGEQWLFHLPPDIPDGFHTVQVNDQAWRIYVRTTSKTFTRFAVGQQAGVGNHIAMDTGLWTVIPMLVLVPILCAVIYGLTWRALRPLVDLAANLNRRPAVDVSPIQAPATLPTELQPIVAALNAMVDRMRNALECQRRFISDAAHELRSPIAALSLQVQNLEASKSEAERAERGAALRNGLARTGALLEQLLTLA